MSTAIERFDDRIRRWMESIGRTRVYEGELVRHPAYTRFLHWGVAIFFILALTSGLAVYSPMPFKWFTPLLGGPQMARLLHPWFSLGFVVFFVFQMLNWLTPMRWTEADRRWLGRVREYVTNSETREPDYVGFFNAGQKIWFWAIVGSVVVFLATGVLMWFPEIFGRSIVAAAYPLHDVCALVMLGGFIVHLYEGTAVAPGTFRSMIRGTVSRSWAWTHHPAWYREATGRERGR
jgi:formate dehydrogenase subunit gamma